MRYSPKSVQNLLVRQQFVTRCACLAILGASSACIPQPPHLPDGFALQTASPERCDDSKPLVIEWGGFDRAELESAVEQDLIIVSKVGCSIRVLSRCMAGAGKGTYEPVREPLDISDDKTIVSEDQLKANLPFSFATLRGYLQREKSFSLRYTIVGKRETRATPKQIGGECSKATHYARAVMVGAYDLHSTSDLDAGGGAEVLSAEIAGASRRKSRFHSEGRDLEKCRLKKDPNNPACKGILQLELARIDPSALASASLVPSEARQFDLGLGELVAIPNVEQLPLIQGEGVPDGGFPDTRLLDLVQAAQEMERKPTVNADGRREAWDSVIDYTAKNQSSQSNEFRALATRRRDAWEGVAVAEAQQARQAKKVCEKYPVDQAKLEKLLNYPEYTRTDVQKRTDKRQFDLAYAPFVQVLNECPLWKERAAQPWVQQVLTRKAARDEAEGRRQLEEQEAHERAEAARVAQENREREEEADRNARQRFAEEERRRQAEQSAAADAERQVETNLWFRGSLTYPLGIESELVRWRWKHFQLSTLRAFYVHFGDAGDVAKDGQGGGVGGAGFGWKWHAGHLHQWEFGFLVYPLAMGYYHFKSAVRSNIDLTEFGWLAPYVACTTGGVHFELGGRVPMLWQGDEGKFMSGSPHVALIAGLGY
jgi:hypothetical protein